MDKEKLKALLLRIPMFKQLAPAAVDKLSEQLKLFVVAEKKFLFRKAAKDSICYFLVSGEVVLVYDEQKKTLVKAGTTSAANALMDKQPRICSCVTRTRCVVLAVDRQQLDLILTWNQVADIEVSEMEEENSDDTAGEWMKHLLSCKAFAKIPPSNIQAMFMCMHEIQAEKGRVLFSQGDKGDYFYLIRKGQCDVIRETNGKKVKLATLKDGDTFGEESLLTDAPRNATIAISADSTLMRMNKVDFNRLLREPMLDWVNRKEADQMVDSGEAQWLDVRLDNEHKEDGIEGSIHIPLFMLRIKADSLQHNQKYILYCNTGRRSSAGAYLLSEQGIDASCLKGGLNDEKD